MTLFLYIIQKIKHLENKHHCRVIYKINCHLDINYKISIKSNFNMYISLSLHKDS